MRGPAPSEEQVAALTAYLESLSPPPSLAESKGIPAADGFTKGARIFNAENCGQCHQPDSYTSDGAFDVGLEDELGNRHFNPPSLRGVGHQTRLFHDNRATSLTDVFARFNHGLERPLSREEIANLVKYLEGL